VAALESTLNAHGLLYLVGKTWTTDAPYRESRDKVDLRRQEGWLTVEMEASALIAAAQFRNVVLGKVLYGGDDLSGDEWDHRN
jgi:uridine phosphorylase